MPTVRFQITGLLCSKTEDRGLLDSRSEDEVYLHGAICAGDQFHPLLVGDVSQATFRHLTIVDGERISLPASESNGWVVDLPEDGHLIVGLAAHEEDANRSWPSVEALTTDIAKAVHEVVGIAKINGRTPDPNDLVGASTSVMRAREKFDSDDLLGKLLLDKVAVADLQPGGFDCSIELSGGSRVLATDFDYTLYYRISRDDRDYAAKPERDSVAVSLKPGDQTTMTVSFLNTGNATFDAEDTVLVGGTELAGWITPDVDSFTLTEDVAGLLLTEPSVAPGETLKFTLPITALPVLGKAKYSMRLFIPSLKLFIEHAPFSLELSSGRSMACSIEMVSLDSTDTAQIRVVARDVETQEVLQGFVKVTGNESAHPTSVPFKVHSNLRHLIANPTAKGAHDQVVWPFGSVQADGYWPELVSLRPSQER